jgi:DNA-binding response OmpR family regulator
MARRILVFNDDADTLEMYKMVLEYEGYEPSLHIHGKISQAEFESFDPDLVILDWMYGREELGLTILQQIQTFPSASTVPIIVCTAGGQRLMEQYETTFQQRDVSVLHKPFELHVLQSLISSRIAAQ